QALGLALLAHLRAWRRCAGVFGGRAVPGFTASVVLHAAAAPAACATETATAAEAFALGFLITLGLFDFAAVAAEAAGELVRLAVVGFLLLGVEVERIALPVDPVVHAEAERRAEPAVLLVLLVIPLHGRNGRVVAVHEVERVAAAVAVEVLDDVGNAVGHDVLNRAVIDAERELGL